MAPSLDSIVIDMVYGDRHEYDPHCVPCWLGHAHTVRQHNTGRPVCTHYTRCERPSIAQIEVENA